MDPDEGVFLWLVSVSSYGLIGGQNDVMLSGLTLHLA